MSVINRLIRTLDQIQQLCEAAKTAEKARVATLKAEASTLFEVSSVR